MRKFFFAVILLLAVYFLFARFSEVENIVETLQRGNVWFILAAILLLILWCVVYAASYQVMYSILGMYERLPRLVLVTLAANFVNIIAPSAGVSGIAVYVGNANSQNNSTGKVTIASALVLLFDYIGFLVVLVLGLAVLARRNQLTWAEISASIILVLLALFLTGLLYLGARSAELLGKTLVWLARRINAVMRVFSKKEYISIDRAYTFAEEASSGIAALKANPGNWIKPFILALCNKTLMIGILMMVFLAFKVPFTAGTLIAGFSIGYLFLIVSPTPSGIGIVEGILTLTLRSLMVPLEAAAIIVLAYRGITFWIPLLMGLVAFRIVSGGPKTGRRKHKSV